MVKKLFVNLWYTTNVLFDGNLNNVQERVRRSFYPNDTPMNLNDTPKEPEDTPNELWNTPMNSMNQHVTQMN